MANSKRFWGLVVETGKSYAQNVGQSFCISMAVLEEPTSDKKSTENDPVKVYAKYDKTEYLLCILSSKNNSLIQTPLNVKFETGSQLTLRASGGVNSSKVHLTGYCLGQSFLDASLAGMSAISVPFVGQQQSILVSAKKENTSDTEKVKKRVSIEDADNLIIPIAKRSKLKESSLTDEDDAVNGFDLDSSEDDDDEEVEEEESDSDFDILKDVPNSQERFRQSYMEETFEEEEEEDDDEAGLEEDDDDEDVDEEEDDEDEEDVIELPKNKKHVTSTPKQSKIPVTENSKTASSSTTPQKISSPTNTTPNSKTANKQVTPADVLKTPDQSNRALKTPSSAGHTPMRYVSKGGVMVQEVKVGTGQIAKPGKMVAVYYEGRLKGKNETFDALKTGAGFKFRLKKGEVIKGWDVGVEGMRVGGKRKLVIPPNLAYGKRGMPPDIPPQSTLVFDVELRNVVG